MPAAGAVSGPCRWSGDVGCGRALQLLVTLIRLKRCANVLGKRWWFFPAAFVLIRDRVPAPRALRRPPQDVRLAFTHGAEGGGRARRGVPGRRACTSASLRWDSVPVHGVLKVTQTRALEWAGAALLQRGIRCPLCMAAPARVRERGGRAPARLSPTSVCFNARSTGFPGGLPSRH